MFIGICCRSQVSVYRTIGPLVCNKFSNLRLDLLTKLDIPTDYQGLKPNPYESITLLNKLLNPQTIDNVKLISYFISSALSLR